MRTVVERGVQTTHGLGAEAKEVEGRGAEIGTQTVTSAAAQHTTANAEPLGVLCRAGWRDEGVANESD